MSCTGLFPNILVPGEKAENPYVTKMNKYTGFVAWSNLIIILKTQTRDKALIVSRREAHTNTNRDGDGRQTVRPRRHAGSR